MSTAAPKWKIWSKRIHIDKDIRQAVLAQLDNLQQGIYFGGDLVYQLERDFSRYIGVPYAVAVNSGTSALLVALLTLDLGPGDEILVSANSYVSSAEIPAFVGAVPVFCDVDYDTANVTAATLAPRITARTRAIALTHMYGQPVDMDPVMELARRHNLYVIEVCPHALGAEYRGRKAGSFGDIGVFSVGNKNIAVGGHGGLVTTGSRDLYEKAAAIAHHGWPRLPVDDPGSDPGMFRTDRNPVRPGLNIQLEGMACAIALVGMRKLDQWNERRRRVASSYTRLIEAARLPVRPLAVRDDVRHCYLHYVVRAPRRDELRQALADEGIEARVHYPITLPDLDYYHRHFPTAAECYPNARRLAGEVLTLPTHPWLAEGDLEAVVGTMTEFYRPTRRGSG